jgi:hypothetical protein
LPSWNVSRCGRHCHSEWLNAPHSKCGYRRLAMAVLSAHVKALKDIDRRNGGEPVDTPQIPEVLAESGAVGGSLS